MRDLDQLSHDDREILRRTTALERRQIKQRTAQLVRLAGGVEFLAPSTGVKKAQLSKYGSDAEPESFINAAVIVELDRTLGAPMMVSALAAMEGFSLVPMAEAEAGTFGMADIAALSAAHGKMVSTLAEALADGQVDAAERRAILAVIDEKLLELKKLRAKVAS